MSDSDDESVSSESDSGSLGSDDSSPKPVAKKQKVTKQTPVKPPPTTKPSNVSVQAKPSKVIQQSTVPKQPSSMSHSSSNMSAPPVSADSTDITRGAPVTTDIAAKKLMSQYLRQQNRPYSSIQIHDNLHKRIPKATVERVLTSMCLPDSGFVCKEYGKAKIYFVDQASLPSDYTADQLDELRNENDELKNRVDQAAAQERAAKAELQHLLAEPSDQELTQQLLDINARITEKRFRVERLSGKGGTSSAASSSVPNNVRFKSLADAVSAHNQFRRAWQTRKGLCMEAVDMLSEGMGKKVKDVMVSAYTVYCTGYFDSSLSLVFEGGDVSGERPGCRGPAASTASWARDLAVSPTTAAVP